MYNILLARGAQQPTGQWAERQAQPQDSGRLSSRRDGSPAACLNKRVHSTASAKYRKRPPTTTTHYIHGILPSVMQNDQPVKADAVSLRAQYRMQCLVDAQRSFALMLLVYAIHEREIDAHGLKCHHIEPGAAVQRVRDMTLLAQAHAESIPVRGLCKKL
ncbi:hypothetical protein K431DRAFT_330351 [Polychaeton citri CBS 116435]|uniref:Uncharacterized protein n=1 Tax=Polychaeton citri CBS 116435 TaxID=1314669 RepID=A0A9P4UR58_9PEZI|nr:hypothetical protein K431DRAFT_330351 [Polychaeton citri CBS 116435]